MQFVTGSYTGNGVDDRWIDPGFEPDLVIIKGGTTQEAVWRSSTMTAGDSAYFSEGAANVTNRIQAFGANGFQVGDNAEVNGNGIAYYWAAFRDDGVTDFEVGTYTGDGNDNRNIAGVGFQPTIVWTKGDTTQRGCWRVAENAGDDTLKFHDAANDTNCIQALQADGFQVGTHAQVNSNGVVYHYVCFADVASYIETGDYTGDGVDDRDIAVGFEPDLVFVKGDLAAMAYFRIDTMAALDSARLDPIAPTTNRIQAFGLTTFMVGDSAEVNTLGEDYYWAAWKQGSTGATTSTSTSTTTTTTSTSTSTTTTVTATSTSTTTTTSTSTSTTLDPTGGGLCWGEENPTAGEVAISWQVMSDGAGGQPVIAGDQDWGKLQLSSGDEGHTQVHDFGNANARTYTVAENRYGTGQGSATLQIRGSANPFTQDQGEPPNWENYVGAIIRSWRYVQVREDA